MAEDAISDTLDFLAGSIAWDRSLQFQEVLAKSLGLQVCQIISGEVPGTPEQLAQSLGVAAGIVRFLFRSSQVTPDAISLAAVAHSAILSQLKLQDVPDDVKVAAVTATGVLFTAPGVLQHLPAGSLEAVLRVLQTRLRSDSTREAVLVAVTRMARCVGIQALFQEQVVEPKSSAPAAASPEAPVEPARRSRLGIRRRETKKSAPQAVPSAEPPTAAVEEDEILPGLLAFLRKTSKTLRHRTASFLLAVITETGAVDNFGGLPDDGAFLILEASVSQMGGWDTQLTHVLLNLLVKLTLRMKGEEAFARAVEEKGLPVALALAGNPFIPASQALGSLVVFFRTVVDAGVISAPDLMTRLEQVVLKTPAVRKAEEQKASDGVADGPLDMTQLLAVSQCTAAVLIGQENSAQVLKERFLPALAERTTALGASEPGRRFVAFVLGEAGARADLSAEPALHSVLVTILKDVPAHPGDAGSSKNLRWAASYALGRLAVGNLTHFLPLLTSLVEQIESENPDLQYGFLNALKELVVSFLARPRLQEELRPHAESVLRVLEAQAQAVDEGVRVVIAETLGRVCRLSVDVGLPVLTRMAASPDIPTRSLTATSLRYCIWNTQQSGGKAQVSHSLAETYHWNSLSAALQPFLQLLQDPDFQVRRQIAQSLRALVRAHAEVIPRDQVQRVCEHLYREVQIDKAFVREVNYGAWVAVVDDRLPLRSAGFELLGEFLEQVPMYLSLSDHIRALLHSLQDDEGIKDIDVQKWGWGVLGHLARSQPEAAVEQLDQIPSVVQKTIVKHVRLAGVDPKSRGEDGEKSAEVLQAMVEGMTQLAAVPGASSRPVFFKFWRQIKATKALKPMLEKLDASAKFSNKK